MTKSKKLVNFEKIQQLHFFIPYDLINKAQSFQFAEFKDYAASAFFLSHYGKFMVYAK